MKPTIIHRRTKRECMKAVLDLEKRGFEIMKPIEEIFYHNKDWTFDSYHFPIFQGCYKSSCWRAIMKKVTK